MTPRGGNWTKLPQRGTGPGARSSHAITVVHDKVYAFGGELQPRVPVDNQLYVFDLNHLTWSTTSASGDIPPPRVGMSMASIGSTIYVFGGRDADHNELNELYAFDTGTNVWVLVSSGNDGPVPRSYHSMACDDHRIYIFGGCGVSGRLNDLWAYDTINRVWTMFPLPREDCLARGGSGLAVICNQIWIVYGFSGIELDDVHCYDMSKKEWYVVHALGQKPTARSVFCIIGIGKYILIYGGEINPSEQGHMGAGAFSADVYSLDTESRTWVKLDDFVHPDHHPGPRGWCAFSSARLASKDALVVYGGNSPNNDRLADIFLFTPS